jgi:uncharacterized protein YbcI
MSGTEEHSQPTGLSPAASISNRVVQLMSSYTGRGPTKAWTSIDEDLISTVLRDTLTKGERSLVADGRTDLVLGMRKAYQDTMREDLVAVVEQISGRKVIAFLSDNHIDPDIAVESFVLEPRPGPDSGDGSSGGA